jgi:hypothetical protein
LTRICRKRAFTGLTDTALRLKTGLKPLKRKRLNDVEDLDTEHVENP